jgi:hypothetical protein
MESFAKLFVALAFDNELKVFTICMHLCAYIVFYSLSCSVCSVLNN